MVRINPKIHSLLPNLKDVGKKEWSRVYNKIYRESHQEEIQRKTLNWKHNHSQRTKEMNAKSRSKIKKELFKLLGEKCFRCGFSDIRALQVDHINGAKEARKSTYRCGNKLYASILRGERNLKNFQLLCANCNWIKRYENGENN